MIASKHEFVTLDGLRGVAAIAVATRHSPAFWHTLTAYGTIPTATGELPEVGPLFGSYLAVDFFFVLSGFVLMHAYGRRLRDGMSTTNFMLVRLIRLYPLYLLALGLSLLPSAWAALHLSLNVLSLSTFGTNVIFAILMLPSPGSDEVLFPFNVPAWSLFFELFANAIFALNRQSQTVGKLSAIVAGSGILLCCAVLLGWFGFGTGTAAMDSGWSWESFGAGVLRVSFSFFAGVLTYRVYQRWPNRLRIPPAVLAVILIAVFTARPPLSLETVYDLFVTIIVFPALVWAGASSKTKGYWTRIFLSLGLASYGVYVLQAPVYGTGLKMLEKLTIVPWFTPLSGITFIVFLLLFALAVDYLLDIPVRRWLTLHLTNARYGSSRAVL